MLAIAMSTPAASTAESICSRIKAAIIRGETYDALEEVRRLCQEPRPDAGSLGLLFDRMKREVQSVAQELLDHGNVSGSDALYERLRTVSSQFSCSLRAKRI
jgi:hypothetical protein